MINQKAIAISATDKEVEGEITTNNTGRTSKESLDLSDDEVRVMNKILRVTPGLTKEQYLKELKAIKEKGN